MRPSMAKKLDWSRNNRPWKIINNFWQRYFTESTLKNRLLASAKCSSVFFLTVTLNNASSLSLSLKISKKLWRWLIVKDKSAVGNKLKLSSYSLFNQPSPSAYAQDKVTLAPKVNRLDTSRFSVFGQPKQNVERGCWYKCWCKALNPNRSVGHGGYGPSWN